MTIDLLQDNFTLECSFGYYYVLPSLKKDWLIDYYFNQPTLSNLSTAEQMDRNFSSGTPQTANIPSNNWRWFTCKSITNFRIMSMHLKHLQHTEHFNLGPTTAVPKWSKSLGRNV